LRSNQDDIKVKPEEITPTCPYCYATLKKEPKGKTKCPNCKQPIFVKSRPSDRTKRPVTQKQAEDIDHEWDIVRELATLPDVDKKSFEQIKVQQLQEEGKEIPKQLHRALHSVRRDSYARQGLEFIEQGHFGLFRNTRSELALLLEEEGKKSEQKLLDALAAYLELCYIDLNGPRNSTKLKTGILPDLTKEQKHALARLYDDLALFGGLRLGDEKQKAELAVRINDILGPGWAERAQAERAHFEPNEGGLAIGIVATANSIIERLALSKSEVKSLFEDQNSKLAGEMNTPLSVDEAWKRLEPDLVFEF
jgi:uncharacterized Zn finger protein (UPF0148 family)